MHGTNTPNFASILDECPTEVVRPPAFPVGTYHCIVQGWERGQSSKKKTPFVKFTLKPIAAMEDVDETELADFGALADRTLSVTFYITEDAVSMLDDFHQNCGLDLASLTKVSRLARNDLVINQEVLAVVEQEIAEDDPSRVFARVRRTAKAK